VNSDWELRNLTDAIVRGDTVRASRLLSDSPSLAKACFHAGATRQNCKEYYLEPIGRYVIAGDTALHIAAASYRTPLVQRLIGAGADVHAQNRLGAQPLHAAATGFPGSPGWDPSSQAATIRCLVEGGANPNATDKRGVSPLHRAVRTRSAAAVRTLLECGADPTRKNKSGSTPVLLATKPTGRGGVGSPEAKREQVEILQLLRQSLSDFEARSRKRRNQVNL
jgi:ankyrin repeat protein